MANNFRLSGLAVRTSCQDQLSGLVVRTSCQDQLSETIVRTSCHEQLSGPAVRTSCQNNCQEQLSGTIVRNNCQEQYSGPAVRNNCQEQWSRTAFRNSVRWQALTKVFWRLPTFNGGKMKKAKFFHRLSRVYDPPPDKALNCQKRLRRTRKFNFQNIAMSAIFYTMHTHTA